MSFFGSIFYIIIIVIFINAKKAAKSGSESKQGKSQRGNYSGKQNIPVASKKAIKTIPNVPKNGKTIIPNVPENGKTAIPNVPVKRKTDKRYLEPHREEKVQPKIRTNNLWGEDEHAHQRIVAIRLMEGDPVPEGYVRVKCPYCNADNLVTKNCRQYHSCYFCRVPID